MTQHASLTNRLKRIASGPQITQAKQRLRESVDQGLDRHVRLAVTGLSRSGKTVFISALIHQLLHSEDSQALPFFTVSNERRILGVRQLAHDAADCAVFPYAEALQRLNEQPARWPESTEALSSIRLAIRYRPRSRLHRMLSETATLYLDIIDYPGEWLLDLPLLACSYDDWSRQCQTLFTSEPRATLAADWLQALARLDPEAPADTAGIQILSTAYKELLQALRQDPYALSLLQPGRFVLPGELANSDLLAFFPLACPASASSAKAHNLIEGSNRAVLQSRFETYQSAVIERFYREHFSRFDRQIVLVDCLKTLNRGQECFDDMQRALTQILHSFQYGRNGLLRRLFKPRIDKVLFACTKADHVTANQHHNLEQFLGLIIDEARRDIRFEGIETQSLALASIRCTEAAEAVIDGQRLSCLRGWRKNSHEPVALFPGEVPIQLPTESDWHQQRFQFIDFAPPRIALTQGKASSHIRLDQALEYLLGDKFV